jgi:hypothetical protein
MTEMMIKPVNNDDNIVGRGYMEDHSGQQKKVITKSDIYSCCHNDITNHQVDTGRGHLQIKGECTIILLPSQTSVTFVKL